MDELKLPYVTIHYEVPIIYLRFKKKALLGFPEIHELIEYAEHLSNKTNYVVLSNVGETVTLEEKFFALQSKNSPFQKGTAVWVKGHTYSLVANLFIGLLKPEFPYKVFTDEKEAKGWLLSLPLTGENFWSC